METFGPFPTTASFMVEVEALRSWEVMVLSLWDAELMRTADKSMSEGDAIEMERREMGLCHLSPYVFVAVLQGKYGGCDGVSESSTCRNSAIVSRRCRGREADIPCSAEP